MISFWICAPLVLLLACTEQGSAQNIPCSTVLGCVSITLVDSIEECCTTGGQTYRPSETSETCQLCYLYGWVQNIAADESSAEQQENIPLAVEGQEIALNIYFRNNVPPNDAGFLFTIETGGTAEEGTDYTISHPEPLLLVSEPVPVTVRLLNDRVAGEDFDTIILTLHQDEDLSPSNIDQILLYPTVQITIQDNDLETGFSVSELTIPESNDMVQVCLSTEGTPATDTIIDVTLIPGTAGEDDFNLVTEQVVITTDETCVSFIALADSLGLEGQETLSLMLSGPENVQFENDTLTITINDTDVVVFGFIDGDEEGKEETEVIEVTITRSIPTAADISFTISPLEFSDSFDLPIENDPGPDSPAIATPGADFPTEVIRFTVPAGSGSVVTQIPIINDTIAENFDQYFIAVLAFDGDSTGAVLGTSVALLSITDDENIILTFIVMEETVVEGDINSTLPLIITKSLQSEQTYTLRLQGITGTAGEQDFSVSEDAIRFTPSEVTTSTFVGITGDEKIELTEEFRVSLERVSGPFFLTNESSEITVNIEDDDGNYMYESDFVFLVIEGDVINATFTLTNPPPDGMFEFDFDVILNSQDGEAIGGSDYTEITGLVVSPTQSPNGTIVVTVDALEDDLVENPEGYFVTAAVLGDSTPVVFSNDLEVLIVSTDTATIGFDTFDHALIEGTTADVCLFSLAENLEVTVSIRLSAVNGTAVEGEDFTAESTVVNFGPDDTGSSGSGILDSTPCITVTALSDGVIEPAENLSVVAEPVGDSTDLVVFQGSNTATVTIRDATVVVALDEERYSTSEMEDFVQVCVIVTGGTLQEEATIFLSTVDGSATENLDYFAQIETPLELDPGTTTACIDIDIIVDDQIEDEEEFSIEISSDSLSVAIPDATSTVTIEGEVATIRFESESYFATEMEPTVDVCVSVVNGFVTFDVLVLVDIRDTSTAAVGEDFDFPPGGFDIPAGTNRGCLEIFIIPSDVVEGEERIELILADTTPMTLRESPITTTVTIASDGEVSIGFSSDIYQISEEEVLELVVVKTGSFDSDISVVVFGEDLVDEIIVFLAGGATTTSITIEIDGFDDDIALQPDRVFEVSLSLVEAQPQVTIPDESATAVVIIVDNDGPVVVGFDQPMMTVSEDAGEISVVVRLDQEVAVPVTVNFDIVSGSAVEGEDFFGTGFSPLIFDPSGIREISLIIEDDDMLENNEQMSIFLSNALPAEVIIDPDTIEIIITDNDRPVIGFEQANYDTSEIEGSVEVCIDVRNGDLVTDLTVELTVLPSSTAIEGDDFEFFDAPVIITAGMNRGCLTIIILPSEVVEGEEVIVLGIDTVSPDAEVVDGETTITILSDGAPRPPDLVNDTIIGDPFYTAPIEVDSTAVGLPPDTTVSLCYEFHGQAGELFNIVNDFCTLVNAHYTQPVPGLDINVIDEISIRAVDSAGECRNISMSLDGCSVTIDGTSVDRYERNDINVRRYTDQARVRVSVPNCERMMLVMWMICDTGPLRNPDTGADIPLNMIKFVIARGISISQRAHGLLGQMWNVPFEVVPYTGALGFLDPTDSAYYITVDNILPNTSPTRTFLAVLQIRSWDRTRGPCLYAGNRQAGPTGDIPEDQLPNDSVIEGEYRDYIVSGEYATDCFYCGQFDESRCNIVAPA